MPFWPSFLTLLKSLLMHFLTLLVLLITHTKKGNLAICTQALRLWSSSKGHQAASRLHQVLHKGDCCAERQLSFREGLTTMSYTGLWRVFKGSTHCMCQAWPKWGALLSYFLPAVLPKALQISRKHPENIHSRSQEWPAFTKFNKTVIHTHINKGWLKIATGWMRSSNYVIFLYLDGIGNNVLCPVKTT